jgi:AcrR family transcriptional regulator
MPSETGGIDEALSLIRCKVIHKMKKDSEAPSRLKERMRQVARDTILDAAERVCVRHGFDGGRMEQIAAAAGVSVGTLYNYFSDRRALVSALVEERRAELLDRVDAALAEAPEDPVERLRALARSVLEHVEAHRGFVTLLIQEAPDAGKGAGLAGPTRTFMALQSRAREVLERVRAQRRLRDEDPVLLSHLFTGALRAVIVYGITEHRTGDPKATADRVLRCFLEGAGAS